LYSPGIQRQVRLVYSRPIWICQCHGAPGAVPWKKSAAGNLSRTCPRLFSGSRGDRTGSLSTFASWFHEALGMRRVHARRVHVSANQRLESCRRPRMPHWWRPFDRSSGCL